METERFCAEHKSHGNHKTLWLILNREGGETQELCRCSNCGFPIPFVDFGF